MRHGETLKGLMMHAAHLGVRVHVAYLPNRKRGVFDRRRQRVIYALDLTPVEQLSVLAHELGHAFHDHACSGDRHAELQADIYAARLLIDPAEYARCERLTMDVEYIAEEMGIIPELVVAWQAHCVTRLRGVSYTHPRMGVGQWAHRVMHA